LTIEVHWFGKPWDAEICRGLGRGVPTPAGVCFRCSKRFEPEDQGVELSEPGVVIFFHRKCLPLWAKERELPLDIRRVMDRAIASRQMDRLTSHHEDRKATERFVAERETGVEPGDAWESPSWEDP
jgi:hypothetical protein